MADFWDKYQEASEATDTVAKLRGLTECITQTEDKVTRRIAAHDLGLALYQGKDGFPQDKEKGKKLMELSAELGHGPAMNLYGQMLTHEGDLNAIAYFCMALNEGQIAAAKNLNEMYTAFKKSGSDQLCDVIESAVGEVVRLLKEDGDLDEDKNGSASLTMALIGLYGLGDKCGISVEQGEEYLQQSAAKGNGIADTIVRNPELKGPATVMSFNPYKEKDSAPVKESKGEKLDKEDAGKETKDSADSAPLQGDVVEEPAAAPESDPMTTKDWLKFGGIVLGGAVILRLIGIPLLIGIAIVLFVIFKFVK